MAKTIITIGGILHLLGGLFHVWMGFEIHMTTRLDPSYRALVEMLNVSTVLMSLFFSYISFIHRDALMATALGHSAIWMMMIIFLSRAVGEIVFFNFGVFWFGISVLIAILYAIALISIRSSNRGARP